MENFIFRKKRKMDEVKHKEKVKELQDKYIPFLESLIKKLQNTDDAKSREAQVKKMQSLHDLLKNKPKNLKCDILEKTEQVLVNLYQKFGLKNKPSENNDCEDPDGSKVVALRPSLEVERVQSLVNLDAVKQKLLHVNDAPVSRELDVPGNNAIDALKQKASAIIGDKVRPTDPRLERRAVTSEITLQVNRISTVVTSRDNRNMLNARPDPPGGYPIPLASFQGGPNVNLFCRRQDRTVYQQHYPIQIPCPPHQTFSPPNPGPSHQICSGLPENPAMRANLNILNSPPLSNDDIQSLMGEPETTTRPPIGSTTTISKSETVRLAVKYHPHPPKKSFEKTSSHLPIDSSGNITVSLDDPRLKKPLPPPRSDPRRDPRMKRNDPPSHPQTVSRYDNRKPVENRKVVDTRSLEYKCNNPAPPKKTFNPMERRSELDDDYIDSSQYTAVKPVKNDLAERKKFDKSKAIESAPRESQACDSTVKGLKSQFDDMYRKNDFTQEFDKRVKTINKGIQSFKIPKKPSSKSEGENDVATKPSDKETDEQSRPTKEKKSEKSVEKTIEGKPKEPSVEKIKKKKKKQTEKTEELPTSKTPGVSKKKMTSDTEESIKKASRRRIILASDSDSDNSDKNSETLLCERVRTKKSKSEKTKKTAEKKKPRAVSEEKIEEEAAHQSKASTPEPVSSSSQVESEKCETSDPAIAAAPVEADAAKDGITKEWLEGFLSNMFSPNNYTKNKLLDIMKTVLDDKKFEQVKSIFESEDDKTKEKEETPKEEQEKSEKPPEEEKPDVVAETSDVPKSDPPEQKPKKKKNRELDRLNEDIRTMFISEGVLTATGRRMCTALRRKPICYAENSPPSSPTKELKNVEEPEPAQPETSPPKPPKPQTGAKRGRKKKEPEKKEPEVQTTQEAVTTEVSAEKTTEEFDVDIAKKFFEDKQLNINRMLKVELQKLKESEITQSTSPKRRKKGAPKKVDDDTSSVSDPPTPRKKKMRRNGIWFRNPKKKPRNPRSAASAEPEIETAELPEPPLKKKPGPKSKTQIMSPPESKKTDYTAAPMDIDYSLIKKEKATQLTDIKNTDVTVTVVNSKGCQICGYAGKAMVSHYVKAHSLHEVFCSRLPKNISEFLKKHENGMLHAESYNMKLQYSGSKIFGHCIFCREEMYEPPNGWVTHFTKHTGEYEFVCSCGFKSWAHKVIRSHVKKCPERGSYVANVISQDEGKYIEAYMCGDCNFIQLQEVNTRNHVITQHLNAPVVYKVCLLNFCDESVKNHHPIFLEMYKQNTMSLGENQEEGVFKATHEKDNEDTASKSILADISKTIPNEPTLGIANKLHERFGEQPKIKVDIDSVVVKNEESANEELTMSEIATSSQETASTNNGSEPMDISPPPSVENPIEHDDDEWEDIESDSDESMQGQPGKTGQNKKLARLAQKIGMKSGGKRKMDTTDSGSSKKSKTDAMDIVTTADEDPIPSRNPSGGFEFGKVENLLFKTTDGQPQYQCLQKKCLFITSSMELFLDHLIRVHDDDTWSGYCHLCQEQKVATGCSMIKEFHHLVNEHEWKIQPEKFSTTSDQIKEEARPAIRLRRLSGDKLSAQTDNFKIPTTPTHIRSVTIRRVSKSPDAILPGAAVSGSPPAVSMNPLATSGSFVISRTLASGVSTSAVSGSVGTLNNISTAEPLQTLKTLALSIPASKSIDNADVVSAKVTNMIRSAKVTGRRSTICIDDMHKPTATIARIESANDLKPWTKQQCLKSTSAVSKMLEKEAIFSPFKCMGSECWYFTTNDNDMLTHLKCHDKITEDQSAQTTVSDTFSWLECSYCDYMAGNSNDLMFHLKKEHLYCEYLCPKCFYRACNSNYVARHLLVYHGSDRTPVWNIKSDYRVISPENPVSCVKENVKLLTCKACNLKFLNYVHFENHIRDHASLLFECTFCLAMIRIENMKKHLFCHSIGNFECIYCECAMTNKNNLAQHMCDRHPNKSLLYYNREQVQEHIDKFKLSAFDNFGPSCLETEFITKDCLPKSIHKFPVGISVIRHTPTATVVSPSKEAPAAENPLQLVISNVVSLNTQPKPPAPAPSSFLVIKDVCTLPKETPSTSTPRAGGSMESLKAAEAESEHQVAFGKAMTRAISDWVAKSGVALKDLLKCSEIGCHYQAKGRGDFLEHVDRSHQNALLKCPQCVNVFWHSSSSLWNHLETHGQKRFFCFACDFTGRTEQLVGEHSKSVHSWLGYVTVLINGLIDGGVYLLCPKNTSAAKIEFFKADFVRNIQKSTGVVSVVDATDSFGPDDIEKLPTKPVVAKNIFCKLCNYKTMIVKNLVRHFEAHRQATYVPNLDPVNPVPCLSEKNFDKMTNLACSSNMDRSKGTEPAFIQQQKRFVCGVSYCSYITIDDGMLRSHLSTLHSGETSYKCPHCQLDLLKGAPFSVETIVTHYRLHGPKLFMCDKCQYMNETTVNVERHIKSVHSGAGSIYILRDDSKNDTPVSESTQVQEESMPKKWICNECQETTYLKCDMANHVVAQHGQKYQYVCGYCSTGHPTRHYVVEHIKLRHNSSVTITETYSAIKGSMPKFSAKHVDPVNFWRRDDKGAKSIRGIPCESSEMERDEEDEEENYSDEEFQPVTVAKSVETELAKRKVEDELSEHVRRQRLNRTIQCTICGKTTQSALTMQIVHFPDCHPGVPVSTRIIMTTQETNSLLPLGSTADVQKPQEEVLETPKEVTGYVHKCFHCSKTFQAIEDFKKHFVENHTEEGAVEIPPCWFFAVKTMYCGLCQEVCDTYDVVAKHLLLTHKTDSVIAKSTKEGMNCGACNYNADDDQNLLRHAKLRHTNSTAKHVITQIVLEQLLQIQMFPMKRCITCRDVICMFDNQQSGNHLRVKHNGSVNVSFVDIRNLTFICSMCHQMFDSETASFTHTLTHVKSFKCSSCNEFFYTYDSAVEHMDLKHGGDVNVIQFTWPTEAILETLIVFPNGLIVSLEELQMTKHRFDQHKFKMVRNEVTRIVKTTSSDFVI